MRMGSVPIEVLDASLEYHRLLVSGENFTEFSTIMVAGRSDRAHTSAPPLVTSPEATP